MNVLKFQTPHNLLFEHPFVCDSRGSRSLKVPLSHTLDLRGLISALRAHTQKLQTRQGCCSSIRCQVQSRLPRQQIIESSTPPHTWLAWVHKCTDREHILTFLDSTQVYLPLMMQINPLILNSSSKKSATSYLGERERDQAIDLNPEL